MNADDVLAVFRRVAESSLPEQVAGRDGVEGLSGARVLELLKVLAAGIVGDRDCYVEIGVYRGLTLSSVAARARGLCVGIDNFSMFNPSGDNQRRVEALLEEQGLSNVELLDLDVEVALESFAGRFPGRQIGLLFVDAGHDYRSQLIALLLARRRLADGAVIVIDDTNYAHVRQATYDFIRAFPEFALLAEANTPAHPANLSRQAETDARRGWWNGIQVVVHDENDRVKRVPPPVDHDRFRQSHDTFRHLLADRAHEVLNEVVSLVDAPGGPASDRLARIVTEERSRPNRFDHQNTDSADRPATWIAELS